jgi:hypothetical protein
LTIRNRRAQGNGPVLPALLFEKVQDGRSSVRILFTLKQPFIAADILLVHKSVHPPDPESKLKYIIYTFMRRSAMQLHS